MNPLTRIVTSIKLRLNRKKFECGDYLEAYATNTDLIATISPELAIGGLWDEMGKHQFEFLKAHGLNPDHKMLDIGCGSLRGGLYFIDYLEQGNYTGFDLSSEVIKAGQRKIEERGIAHKSPNLYVNTPRNLKFDFLESGKFDFLLAQSVFSHLKPEHIEECFDNLHKVMAKDARFFFTHHPGERFRARSKTDFEYPTSFFEKAAQARGFQIVNLSSEYIHPRGQNMLLLQVAGS